mgnify:CR=1 FL=1
MKFPKLWLKDVVVVQFADNGYKGDLLVLPRDIKHHEKIGTATIVAMGNKFRFKDEVSVGDMLYVDTWLGTRRHFEKDVVVYDGEDIFGVVPK